MALQPPTSKKILNRGTSLTEAQKEELRDVFYALDKEKKGYIRLKHVSNGAMLEQGMGDNSDEETQIEDHEKITIDEFVRVMEDKLILRDTSEELREAFLVFDKEGNGFINSVELRRVMGLLGTQLTNEQVDIMLKDFDLDGDGQINYEEFIRTLVTQS